MKLWYKKSSKKLHPLIEAYTVGEDYLLDQVLLPYDITASKAHAEGLKRIGILKLAELKKLLHALEQIKTDFEKGNITIRASDEDCHTILENQLVEKLGQLGKKIHTGRSRNDQVLVALRLYEKDQLQRVLKKFKTLAQAFVRFAKKYQITPMPGYSHTQQAMPTSVGHWAISFAESVADDEEFMKKVLTHIDQNPLGSAAGFGVNLPLDRAFTTKALGFKKTLVNSLYCQVSRGKFESLILEALTQVMMTLSRFASDMIFFTSRECEYFTVDDHLTTGSSIMPQKKNHDALEILRANTSKIMSHHFFVQQLLKNLISGYHRDFQLMKKPVMESFDIVSKSIDIVKLYLGNMRPNEASILKHLKPEILAAEIAQDMTKKGVPFRDAYAKAMAVMKTKKPDWEKSITSKISLGGPGNLGEDHE